MAVSGPAEALSCLLFPLSCLAPKRKYGEETEGKIEYIGNRQTTYYYTDGSPFHVLDDMNFNTPLDSHEIWTVWFRSGQTRYQAWVYYSAVGMATGYHPKRPDWVGHTVKLRFVDKKILGINTPAVQFKRPDGKDWELGIIDIVGPDGINECKAHFCPLQAKVDQPAREAEQLAKLQKAGTDSATAALLVADGTRGAAPAAEAAAPRATADASSGPVATPQGAADSPVPADAK